MRTIRNGRILAAGLACVSCAAWGQGGTGRAGRAAAAQQQQQAAPPGAAQQAPGAAAAQGRGGRGGAGAPIGGASNEFFNYDPNATGAIGMSETAPVETHGKVTVNGEGIAYTARTGFLPLRNATNGQTEAHLFYTYYTKDGATDRPLVFFLGGAPGVSSAWQEFGGLGPKRIKTGADGSVTAPYGWSDNPNTLLGAADLVFVNPVGTAFSRPDQPGHATSFWNTAADAASMGEFVRGFARSYGRLGGPVFLVGEDAGTGRASGVALYLHEHGIPVQGVALLSMTASADASAGDTQYITLFPSLVLAAWKHKKLTPDMNNMSLEQIAGQARQFASREYLHALYKGVRMTDAERTKVVADMARLSGVSKQFIVNNDLRITAERFNAELLRDQHKGLSYSDVRVAGFTPDSGGGRGFGGGGGRGFAAAAAAPLDLAMSALTPPFQLGYEGYLRKELNYTGNSNGLYYLSSGGVEGFTSTGSDEASLSSAFARNPNLRLFVGVNYYDLKSPFYATEYTLAHLNVSPEVRAHNIQVSHYESGQMTYTDGKAVAKLQSDLANFVADAMGGKK